MKAFGVAVVIASCVAVGAGAADADGRSGHFRGDFHGTRRFDGRGLTHRGFVHRPHFPVFVGPSIIVVPSIFNAPAVDPPAYAAPPAYPAPGYAPPPPPYAAPAPPPMPRVVEFPTGRYELRGDGVYTPYAWVWIPNPPVAPPPPPPPTAPPTSTPEPPPARRPAAQTAVLLRWTDERGVTTWTDNIEKVPARYRGQVDRLTP